MIANIYDIAMRLLQIPLGKCMSSSSIFGDLHYVNVSAENKRSEKLLEKMFLWKDILGKTA